MDTVGSWTRRAARFLYRRWRQSLPLRVVTITTIVGGLFTLALGTYMYQQIADGLVHSSMASAEQQSLVKRAAAQNIFLNTDRTDPASLKLVAGQTVQSIGSTGDDPSVLVVLQQSLNNTYQALPRISSGGVSPDIVPSDIVHALAKDPAHQQVEIITAPYKGRQGVPAVLVGSRITVPNAGEYDLYLIYSMAPEQQSLNIVKGSLLAGGLALLLLLAGLAYLVTRMVVAPVRAAAHVSERLTAGALNERMQVSGEDDLARLATSFNAMADSLQRQIRQLEDLSQLQQRFTSDVSHELRTPLTTIRMAADLIHASRDDFTAQVSRSSELLHRELGRFESLLTDLLEISRFDAGAAALTTETVDLRVIVGSVAEGAASLADRAGTQLRVHAHTPALAPMDSRRIERIVRNLVTNAIEHGERRPIDISVGVSATAVAVSVRDYGVGLKPGDQAMVFNRFWRADPARARTTGGTGLGLSISLEDAQLHDGWLQAWGEVGRGACFRLTLPRKAGVPIRHSPVSLSPDAAARGKLPTGTGGQTGGVPPGAPVNLQLRPPT
ncbi:HAMP domain-containing histidine kinase [Leekyejoonella antrihumi]|uniref:Sensor histidine kinase MtrB n=2 Tax=Leekyejoonella antrihumi TaxID=1660198 RepID=A0A563DY32_9MICO|nr:HAMP domain-containing histidine kinase [Leekyejoonella antrihumi]